MTKRILCFGDSNTWGYNAKDGSRYSQDIRWTGRLAKLLPQSTIIEEGLNGRTTQTDYKDRKGKHGLNYLYPCMDSHSPVDLVTLCLGANDVKAEFKKSAGEINEGLKTMVDVILGKGLERPSPGVKVLVILPFKIIEGAGPYSDGTFLGASAKIDELRKLVAAWPPRPDVYVLDLYDEVETDLADGVHITPQGHETIARRVAGAVTEILG